MRTSGGVPASRGAWPLALLLALLLGASGCTSVGSGSSPASPTSPATTGTPIATKVYVALGDSYTAAPGVPPPDSGSGGCFRSSVNYPSLVAEDLSDYALVDVSCSGADTGDLTRPQQTFSGEQVPPQFAALSRRTDLVTIGMGGNDLSVFGTLIGYCPSLRQQDPSGSPCRDTLGDRLFSSLEVMGSRMEHALRGIEKRAPRAQVLVVGYPVLVNADERCPGLLPLADGDLPFAAQVNTRLNAELREAARASGATYVDVAAVTRQHSICSRHPWVNGGASTVGAQLFHPYSSEQRAVADLIVSTVR